MGARATSARFIRPGLLHGLEGGEVTNKQLRLELSHRLDFVQQRLQLLVVNLYQTVVETDQ